MIPQPTEFLSLFAADRRRREAAAQAERFRRDAKNRVSVPPRIAHPPAAVHPLRPAHKECREAA